MIAHDEIIISAALRRAANSRQQEQSIEIELIGSTIWVAPDEMSDEMSVLERDLDDRRFRVHFVGKSRLPVTITRVERPIAGGQWEPDCLDHRAKARAEELIGEWLEREEERVAESECEEIA